jgi:hypothetical protein
MGYTSTSKNSCAIIVINTIEGMGMLWGQLKKRYNHEKKIIRILFYPDFNIWIWTK